MVINGFSRSYSPPITRRASVPDNAPVDSFKPSGSMASKVTAVVGAAAGIGVALAGGDLLTSAFIGGAVFGGLGGAVGAFSRQTDPVLVTGEVLGKTLLGAAVGVGVGAAAFAGGPGGAALAGAAAGYLWNPLCKAFSPFPD